MNFRVSARTILHLGSELISSDGVAFYELIKNSLDAGAEQIDIEVICRLPYNIYSEILREMGEDREVPQAIRDRERNRPGRRSWQQLRDLAVASLIEGSPNVVILRRRMLTADTRAEFLDRLRNANIIKVDDDGRGMSMQRLEDVYMTIGTSFRATQKANRADGDSVILGEKGLGRLSAMRLGDRMMVVTGRKRADTWNQLDVDWNDFADAADSDLESVEVAPEQGDDKDPNESGTLIQISALRAEWSAEKLEQLAGEHFSKLTDPFDEDSRLPLSLTFNGAPVNIPEFAGFLLQQAHGRFTADLNTSDPDEPAIDGLMEYRLRGRQRRLRLTPLELGTLTGIDPGVIGRIGPFHLELYWFNRRILTKLEGIGSLAVVRRILSAWAGGVAVYRDGYRVNPYGGAYDDWLDLDRDAFSTSGFKLNRGQVIGRVTITQRENPLLIDQTNREGLKDNPEKGAFVKVIAAIVELYRQYLNEIDLELDRARRVTAAEALDRFRDEDERLGVLLPLLESALDQSTEGKRLKSRIRDTLVELRAAAEQVQLAAGAQEKERSRVLHLASVGLMIESLAHELFRATSAGLQTISQARSSRDPADTSVSLRVLDAQLRTLQKRLKVLDPLSTNARQTKERFELASWVEDIFKGFSSRNVGRGIEFDLRVVPDGSRLEINAVKGMFVQVLENLLNNSVYWVLAQHRERVRIGLPTAEHEAIGSIRVEIDTRHRRVVVTDDGPGIPEERRETVFQPFFTTKPQKQGKGLGLYIAREIAEYHGGTLTLGPADDDGQIHSVIFELGEDNG